MKYTKATITITNGYERDLLVVLLGEIGFDSFETENEELISAYIQNSLFDDAKLQEILHNDFFAQLDPIDYRVEECEDKDWNEVWEREYYKPLFVDDVMVRASFHKVVDGHHSIEIIIDPKMAFGTGHHATTASMMRLLKRVNPHSKSVIDMGCGSGILAIYALKLGANKVVAIDFDENSVVNAKENASLNGVELEVLHGDATILPQIEAAEIFMANINRNIILNDLEYYIAKVKDGGRLMLSGFYNEDVPMVAEALSRYGYSVIEKVEENNWVALLTSRSSF